MRIETPSPSTCCPPVDSNTSVPTALDARVARMKKRLLEAPYEVCMARARYFTQSYRATEGQDPHRRNAAALQHTLENQRISIEPDERLAGSKTEKFLAGPLSVERGDFLRTLQLEMDILEKKQKPFRITEEERKIFWKEILPYWHGRTVRDLKARKWDERGLIDTKGGLLRLWTDRKDGLRYIRYLGPRRLRKLLGANLDARPSLRRTRNLLALRYEFARNNPTPAAYCFDVQGHLSLGVDKAIEQGFDSIIHRAEERLATLRRNSKADPRAEAFLQSVIQSLRAAIAYSERFALLAESQAKAASDPEERSRLEAIARHCRHVPRNRPRSFHEALQSAWMVHLVGEIQYGTHDVFTAGRIDQFLYPFYRADIDSRRLTRAEAVALLQEYYLKLSANVEPIPEVGMETNGVLGNSQHCVIIGGLTPNGRDALCRYH